MTFISSHCWKGRLPFAFVLCVPGTKELQQSRPVAGDTGENLESALLLLHAAKPSLFISMHRYDYRITNAFPEPISVALGHKASEPNNLQVLAKQNVERTIRDLEGCSHVVLCGVKAGLLFQAVVQSGKTAIATVHVGNKGLNSKFRLNEAEKAAPSSVRRQRRVELWASDVLCQLEGQNTT